MTILSRACRKLPLAVKGFVVVGICTALVFSLTVLLSPSTQKSSLRAFRSLLQQPAVQLYGVPPENFAAKKEAAVVSKSIFSPLLVIYNRIPKTGSTTFANLAYSLAAKSEFSVIHVNVSHNSPTLSALDQLLFIHNITSWTERLPAFIHGHFAFIDFDQLGYSFDKSESAFQVHPVYINLVRHPYERLVSYFYFLRYGDDFRPNLKRRRAGRNDTFDDCVAAGDADCEPRLLWKQIPFFCGNSVDCWEPGSQWALERAKQNLVSHYLAVGSVEHLRSFVRLVEVLLPRFFTGASELFDNVGSSGHLRKTASKLQPANSTLEKFKQSAGHIWRMEEDFYNFCLRHFAHTYTQVFGSGLPGQSTTVDSFQTPRPSQFHFEKVRPKRPPKPRSMQL